MSQQQQAAATPSTTGADTMKAFVRRVYGTPEVIELVDVEAPVPADDEILVRVRAVCVNPLDWHELTGIPLIARTQMGMFKPKDARIGTDFAGVVEAVGAGVTRFRPGDEVFGMRGGCFAERVCIREVRAARKPANATFEQAASIPVAALTALQALRDKGGIQPGHKVLVNGASGGVGTFGVQLTKAMGAEVTGVCSTRNVDIVRSLGADHVVDYTSEDFAHTGQRYDVILDVAGNRSIADRRRALAPGGVLVVVGGPKNNRVYGSLVRMARAIVAGKLSGRKMVGMLAKNNGDDLAFVADLVEAGKVTPFVERVYPMADLPEALRYQGQGHAQGKIALTV